GLRSGNRCVSRLLRPRNRGIGSFFRSLADLLGDLRRGMRGIFSRVLHYFLTIRRRADYQNNRRRKQKSRFHSVSLLNVFASNAVWLQRSKSSAVSTGKTSCTFNLLLKEAAGTAAGITGPGAHATEANHRTCYSSLAPSISSGACMKHKLGVVALLLLVSLSA